MDSSEEKLGGENDQHQQQQQPRGEKPKEVPQQQHPYRQQSRPKQNDNHQRQQQQQKPPPPPPQQQPQQQDQQQQSAGVENADDRGGLTGWQVAYRGIELALNNQVDEAQKLLKADSSCIHRQAGFCYLTFIVSTFLEVHLISKRNYCEL